jgi:hypothetical protein
MRRDYYLYKRKNGVFYVEFINPENGKKLSTRSTGETDRVKAEVWKEQGVPTGRLKKPRPLLGVSLYGLIPRRSAAAEISSMLEG